MISNYCTESVSVKIQSGTFVDGKPGWTTYSGKAFVTDFTKADIDRFGRIVNGRIFLLICAAPPLVESQIIHAGKTFTVLAVRTCKRINGTVECYRCAVE